MKYGLKYTLRDITLKKHITYANWYHKSSGLGRVFNFLSEHHIQNKFSLIFNLVDRGVYLSHSKFH